MSGFNVTSDKRFIRMVRTALPAIVLMGTMAGVAVAVNPLQGELRTGTVIAPDDAVGLNVLEPTSSTTTPPGKVVRQGEVDRVIQEWYPTRGGKGGGGSPKG